MRQSQLAIIAIADVLVTYCYVIVASGLPLHPTTPHPDLLYWARLPWFYALIVPVAAVAAWRGVRQMQRASAGRPAWWRLPAEGGATAATPLLLGAIFDTTVNVRFIAVVGLFGAGLGLLLTGVNMLLGRLMYRSGELTSPRGSQPA